LHTGKGTARAWANEYTNLVVRWSQPWTTTRADLRTWFAIDRLIKDLPEGLQEYALKKWHQNKTLTLFAMADLVDEEMVRVGYHKDGNMPRPRGGMKRAPAGGRKRVREDVCFICEQPGHWKYNCPKRQVRALGSYKGQSSKPFIPPRYSPVKMSPQTTSSGPS
jgi:Zinc knuckle